MPTLANIRPLGDQLLCTMDDGTTLIAYPTGGSLWEVSHVEDTGPVDPGEPGTGELVDQFTGPFNITGNWEDHASYSNGGTDWGMNVGTGLKAIAAGTIVNLPNIDGAGLKSMLVFDKPFARKQPASSTLMNGVYRENGTAPAVAFMMQHLSSQLPERHYDLGEVCAISGNTGNTTGPHLHAHLLATASVGGDRLDLRKFV